MNNLPIENNNPVTPNQFHSYCTYMRQLQTLENHFNCVNSIHCAKNTLIITKLPKLKAKNFI